MGNGSCTAMPERFERMKMAYADFERENGVQPMPAGYSQARQIALNYARSQFGPGVVIALLTALVVLPFMVFGWMRRKSES